MSSSRSAWSTLLAVAGLWASAAVAAEPRAITGIGRAATAQEIAAWDIDVRADFKGLPRGSGSVDQGMPLWEAKCAACHGVFGESNQVFTPLIGGTDKDDVKNGRVSRLQGGQYPGRSTLMKLSTLSTLWDSIYRSMPWNAPKSLTPDEVYALTAYMLHLAGVLPESFTLSDRNMAEVQALLPNRHGMSTEHGLWPGAGLGRGSQADVKAIACMSACGPEVTVVSQLPAHARNDHGNLAEQNRGVGAQRGADTATAVGIARVSDTPAAQTAAAASEPKPAAPMGGLALARQLNCLSCHGVDQKIVGPGLREVAKRYAGRSDADEHLALKITAGGAGTWGPVPMPPQSVSAADARILAQWIAAGAPP